MNPSPEDLNDDTLTRLIAVVHRYTGVTVSPTKRAMLQSRLRPRMRELGISSYGQYLDLLEREKAEVEIFVDLVTTHETYFYRTPRIWDYFSKTFLPEWRKKNPKGTLRLWSAAASSGEEAYTLGMFCEEFRSLHGDFQYEILATDISAEILVRARQGLYSGRSIEALRSAQEGLFRKYLKAEGDSFRVAPEIRARVRFEKHNLFQPPKDSGRMDLVLLRNVLIYFTPPDQEKLLNLLRRAIRRDDGFLIIGESESLNQLKVPFSYTLPLIYSAEAA